MGCKCWSQIITPWLISVLTICDISAFRGQLPFCLYSKIDTYLCSPRKQREERVSNLLEKVATWSDYYNNNSQTNMIKTRLRTTAASPTTRRWTTFKVLSAHVALISLIITATCFVSNNVSRGRLFAGATSSCEDMTWYLLLWQAVVYCCILWTSRK